MAECDFEKIILALSKHLCIAFVSNDNIRNDRVLIVAPYVSNGCFSSSNSETYSAKKITVMHSQMKVWPKNDKWCIEYYIGQKINVIEYSLIEDVIKLIQTNIEHYWRAKER